MKSQENECFAFFYDCVTGVLLDVYVKFFAKNLCICNIFCTFARFFVRTYARILTILTSK
jgi:hypothetical protein